MTRVTDLVAQGDINGALETTLPHRKRPPAGCSWPDWN